MGFYSYKEFLKFDWLRLYQGFVLIYLGAERKMNGIFTNRRNIVCIRNMKGFCIVILRRANESIFMCREKVERNFYQAWRYCLHTNYEFAKWNAY